jgi:hypothetical protein
LINNLFRFDKLSCLAFKEIHFELFLSICEQYISLIGKNFILNIKYIIYIIIDRFNSTTFIPLGADANGNISVSLVEFF